MHSIIELFKEGGFIMYPLLIFSIITWAVAIYKIMYLNKFRKQARHFHDEATRIIVAKKFHEMDWLYKNCPEVISKTHYAIFDDANSKEEAEARIQRRLIETNQALKKHLWMLGTIGSSAPFVGLFGTVWGIMGSFSAIGAAGKAGFAVVAASISEALIATAAGILVAVVAVMFYNYLNVKIGEINTEFKNALGDMAEQFNSIKK